jgi:hypothetical protein
MLHGPPHGALHVLALVNNGACPSQMAIRSPQHKCPNQGNGGYRAVRCGRRSVNGTKRCWGRRLPLAHFPCKKKARWRQVCSLSPMSPAPSCFLFLSPPRPPTRRKRRFRRLGRHRRRPQDISGVSRHRVAYRRVGGWTRASAEDWSIGDKSAPPVFPEVAKFTGSVPTIDPERRSVRAEPE